MSCTRAAPIAPAVCCNSSHYTRGARPGLTCRLRRLRRTRTRSLRASSRHFPEVRKWSAELKVWCVGMLWPWWCGRIRCKRASADIFLPLHRPQPCTKLHSIIFFMQKRKAAIVTSFIFRAMLLRACTPARIWKAAFRAKNWKTSDAN